MGGKEGWRDRGRKKGGEGQDDDTMAEEEGEDETLFAVTKRVREAVSLMNGVDETKLSVLASHHSILFPFPSLLACSHVLASRRVSDACVLWWSRHMIQIPLMQTSNLIHTLKVVVRRLAKVVGDRVQSAFNEEEVEQLQEHLCLASTELTTVLEGIRYEMLHHELMATAS